MFGLLLAVTVLAQVGLSLSGEVEDNCPPELIGLVDRTYLDVHDGTCYFLSTTRNTYNGARDDCVAKGGTLAMPKTKDADQFLSRFLQKNEILIFTYIGLNDRTKEGTFVWEDGTVLDPDTDHVNFDANNGLNRWDLSRNTNNKDCVAIVDREGRWHDVGCDGLLWSTYYSICQFPSNNAVTGK